MFCRASDAGELISRSGPTQYAAELHQRSCRRDSGASSLCMASAAMHTTAMMQVEKAAACDTKPASSSRITDTAAMLTDGVTRKITADSVTIERMNRKKNTATSVGAITGTMTLASTWAAPLPRQLAASSSAGGTARMPVTMVRKPWVW